jgi:hypothetical protein
VDADNSSFDVTSTSVVADASLSVVGISSVTASAGSAWSGQLATFSDPLDSNGTSSDYTATIAWGDGQSSAGTIGISGSNFTVSGTHTYQQASSATISVTINDAGGASVSATLIPQIGGLVASPFANNFTAGVSAMVVTASFSDTDLDFNTSHFAANIQWGDGTTTANATISTGAGGLAVQASHTYALPGYYPITTNITDNVDGQKATVVSHANVTHASLNGNSGSFPSTSLTYSGQTGSFNDGDLDISPSHFQVQLAWGDGSTSTGSISYNASQFVVSGTHTYAANGNYSVTNTITDLLDGSTATVTSMVMVNQFSMLSVTGASNLTGSEGVSLSNLTVASLSDSDNNHSASAYANSTINWGDGSAATSATVTGSGPFTVAGTHTYVEPGTYSITINAQDSDSASAVGTTSIVIGDAALTPTGRTLTATAGLPLNAATVASFMDANTSSSGTVTDFTALLNFGDGTPVTAGYVSGSGGNYTVSAGHLYATANTYNVTVTITDIDGQTATANSTITVSNPSASLTASAVSATEGSSWSSSTAAVFTPASGTGGHTFVATLAWGDGAVTYGTLTSNGQGGFNVSASHTYADETSTNNPETLTVTVLDQTTGAIAARTTAAVTVADAGLSATANSITAWTNQCPTSRNDCRISALNG